MAIDLFNTKLRHELEVSGLDILHVLKYRYDFDNNIFPEWYVYYNYPNHMFDYHYHEALEIIFLKEGRIKVIGDFGTFILKKGDILIANCNEVHSGFFEKMSKELVDYTAVLIDVRRLFDLSTHTAKDMLKKLLMRNIAAKNHITSSMDGHEDLKSIIQRVEKYYDSGNLLDSELLKTGLATELLAVMELSGIFYKTKTDPKTKDKDFSAHVLNYVQANYKEKISTKTASSFFAYDEAQFCRLFKKHFNMTFIEFVNFYRIKIACCHNISDKSATIEHVSKSVGYDNYSYFCRNFKKYVGISPKEFFFNNNPQS